MFLATNPMKLLTYYSSIKIIMNSMVTYGILCDAFLLVDIFASQQLEYSKKYVCSQNIPKCKTVRVRIFGNISSQNIPKSNEFMGRTQTSCCFSPLLLCSIEISMHCTFKFNVFNADVGFLFLNSNVPCKSQCIDLMYLGFSKPPNNASSGLNFYL